MFHEVRIIAEILVLAVLKYEDSPLLQQSLLEDEAGDGGQFLEGVRGIGEDEVETVLARLDETEDITPQGHTGVGAELLQTVLDETVMVAVQFDADDMGTASRHQFE